MKSAPVLRLWMNSRVPKSSGSARHLQIPVLACDHSVEPDGASEIPGEGRTGQPLPAPPATLRRAARTRGSAAKTPPAPPSPPRSARDRSHGPCAGAHRPCTASRRESGSPREPSRRRRPPEELGTGSPPSNSATSIERMGLSRLAGAKRLHRAASPTPPPPPGKQTARASSTSRRWPPSLRSSRAKACSPLTRPGPSRRGRAIRRRWSRVPSHQRDTRRRESPALGSKTSRAAAPHASPSPLPSSLHPSAFLPQS